MLSVGGSSLMIEPNSKANNTKPVTKVALKSRYYSSAEAAIPHLKHRQVVHNPIPLSLPANTLTNLQNQAFKYILQKDNYLQNQSNKKLSKSATYTASAKVLDGFYILDSASVTMPEDVQHLTVSNKNLSSLVEDELTYFTEVLYIDASENFLPFKGFGAFPKLCELRLACNHIRSIPELPYGFNSLQYLDLSYNNLTLESISSLYDIPFLKELDLSGNNLSSLPKTMSSFPALEKFILSFNKFEDNDILLSLSSISTLRYLDISNNFFSLIPHSCLEYNGWKLLETLNLSFNYFSREESVDIITRLPRLVQLMLYGNPLLGPTGEDPMFIYIENLMETAFYIRDHANTSLPDLEFITEVPRKRNLKKGQPLGRLALYRDFAMVQLERSDELLNREWKRQGALSLFTEAMNNSSLPPTVTVSTSHLISPPVSAPSPSYPDMTFLTNSIAAGTFSITNNNKERGVSGSTFYGIEKNDLLANELMQQVADEMGLANNEDFDLFEQYTKLPPSVIEQELLRSIENNPSKMTEFDSLSTPNFTNSLIASDSNSPSPTSFSMKKKNPTDHLPLSLFKDDPDDSLDQLKSTPTTFISQPISLKTAMKTLQRAVENPLTDYYNIPLKHEKKNEKIYEKTTETSKSRQLNRIPLPPLVHQQEKNEKNLHKEHRGLPEAPILVRMKQENRERTMQQIDLVLEDLGQHTDKIISYDKKNQPKKLKERRRSGRNKPRTIEGEYEKSLKSNYNTDAEEKEEEVENLIEENNPIETSHHQSLADVKQSMNRMRDFSRPEKGVKTLLSMVKNIVSEFNDD